MVAERIELIPASLELLDTIVEEDWSKLSTLLSVTLANRWQHFPEATVWIRGHIRDNPHEAPWWSYLVVHKEDRCLIGLCGYKGPPSFDGVVEIGYSIAGDYQGRGLATESAHALIQHAFTRDSVAAVLAHTLPEENASVAVLRKLGFVFVEEITDPEDGTIWRWQLPR